MREHKYRAWAVSSRCMFYPDWELQDGVLRPIPNTILMEYTGFKDEVGREIYEDDIVLFSEHYCGDSTIPQSTQVIKWIDNGWNDYLMVGYMDCPHWCHLLGNRFEHPELLKEPI